MVIIHAFHQWCCNTWKSEIKNCCQLSASVCASGVGGARKRCGCYLQCPDWRLMCLGCYYFSSPMKFKPTYTCGGFADWWNTCKHWGLSSFTESWEVKYAPSEIRNVLNHREYFLKMLHLHWNCCCKWNDLNNSIRFSHEVHKLT